MPKTRAILQLVSTPLLYLFDLNAAAFIKFLGLPMQCLFKGGVYLRVAFISKSRFLNHWEQ